jgi:hypothetical protein
MGGRKADVNPTAVISSKRKFDARRAVGLAKRFAGNLESFSRRGNRLRFKRG